MKELGKSCFWPGMDEDICKATANCETCVANGKNLKTKLTAKDLGNLKTLTEPNEEIQIDFYGPFKYNGTKKFLIVAVDRFSKWVNIKAVNNTGTVQVLKFIKQIITDNGHPKTIKTDNASCFKSKSYKRFLESEGIKYEYVTPYVHTGNGTVERTIGTIDACPLYTSDAAEE